MNSEPVLLESVDIKMWNRLDEIDSLFSSGRSDKAMNSFLSVVEDVSVNLNPIHSAVLVRILNIAVRENADDIQTIATKIVDKCSLTDTYPALEAADILITEGNIELARFILERRTEVSDRAFLEYLLGRICLKEGDNDDARQHLISSYNIDPFFLRTCDILFRIDPEGGWDIQRNIALLFLGEDAPKAERSFSNTPKESLYRIYWEWFAGDKDAAKNMLSISVADNASEFKLAAARLFLMDKDHDTSVRFYSELNDEFQYIRSEFANALISAGRIDDAIPLLNSIETVDPLNRRMLENTISALSELNDKEGVRSYVNKFLTSEHADRKGYEMCAAALLASGETKDAGKLISALISRFAYDHHLFVMRSSIEFSAGRFSSALDATDEAVRLSSKDPDCRYQRARTLNEMGKTKKALRDIDAALTADKGHIKTHMLLKDIRMDQRKYSEVLEICDTILDLDPKNTSVMKDKAYALDEIGDKEGALNEYRKALRIKNDPGLFESVLADLVEGEMYDELNDLFSEFGEAYNKSSMAWRLKGNADYAMGNYQAAMESFGKAADISPSESKIWHSKGMAAEKMGNLRKAEESFDKALLLDLDSPEYWLSKAMIQEKRGNDKGAILALNHVIAESPDSSFALIRKALILTRLGKYDEAIFFFDLALKKNTRDVSLLDMKKEVLKHLFRYEQTIRVSDDVLLVEPKNERALLDKAKAQLSLEQYDKAASTTERALKFHPDSLDILMVRKDALHNIGDHAEEAKVCMAILEIEPNDRQMKMDLAEALAASGDNSGAMSVYDQLSSEDPMDSKVVVMKSKISSSAGEASKAVEFFQEVMENRPNDPDTLNTLAEVMFAEGFHDESLRVIDGAIKLDPKNVDHYKIKAKILMKAKSYEDAQNVLKEALRIDMNDAHVWKAMGEVQEARRDMHRSLLSYDSAMKLGLDDPELYLNRGRVQESLGMEEAAINSYSMAMVKGPNDPRAPVKAAFLQLKMERIEAASQNFNIALSIDPADPNALFGKAKVYIEQGEDIKAKELYEQFIELGTGDDRTAEEFCEMVGADLLSVPSYRLTESERMFQDDIERYSHDVLEYCYNTGCAISEDESFIETNVPEGMVNDILKYLGNIEELDRIDIHSEKFKRLEALSKNLILVERITKIDSEPVVNLSSAYMASGAKTIEEAKELVAYIYHVMTKNVLQDMYPEEVRQIAAELESTAGDVTVYGIMESFDVGVCYAKMAKSISGRKADSIGLHV